jgi:hypothetical protein
MIDLVHQRVFAAAAAVLFGWFCGVSAVIAANSDPVDMEPDLAAKVSREKLKQKRLQLESNANPGGAAQNKANCGSIDIGNNDTPKRGAAAIAKRETTVVVTGNVINATNCR